MAKFEKIGKGNFEKVLNELNNEILKNIISVKLEEKSDFITNVSKTAIRIYERYSFIGSNRLSMSLVLVESDNKLFLSISTSGGSQAIFFKVNKFGEKSFLNTIKHLANQLIK